MNLDITNIGHYRVSSHGGRVYDLFNRQTDMVYTIHPDEYKNIKEHMSIAACEFVEHLAIARLLLTRLRPSLGISGLSPAGKDHVLICLPFTGRHIY